ncbi:MAG: signal peptidase I [Dehalococcoidales bacterium]
MKTLFREVVFTLIFAAVVFLLLQATVQSFIVVGVSMEPSLENGQRLLVSKAAYYLHEPERGDVFVFQPPDSKQGDFIKRVIALPGDTIEVKKKAVYINGLRLEEAYIKTPPTYTTEEQKIPESNYFVLGDNRNNSSDSHNGWLVPRENIVGKAWLSIWPPDKWGLFPDYPLATQPTQAMTE